MIVQKVKIFKYPCVCKTAYLLTVHAFTYFYGIQVYTVFKSHETVSLIQDNLSWLNISIVNLMRQSL